MIQDCCKSSLLPGISLRTGARRWGDGRCSSAGCWSKLIHNEVDANQQALSLRAERTVTASRRETWLQQRMAAWRTSSKTSWMSSVNSQTLQQKSDELVWAFWALVVNITVWHYRSAFRLAASCCCLLGVLVPGSVHLTSLALVENLVALALWSLKAACYPTFTCYGLCIWNLRFTCSVHVTSLT